MSPDEGLIPAPIGERLGDVTRRRLLVTIAGMATPVVFGQLSQTLMGLVDTVMVVTIALVLWPMVDANEATTPLERDVWWGIIIGQYLFKAAVAALDTPLFYLGTRWLRGWIEADPRGEDRTALLPSEDPS